MKFPIYQIDAFSNRLFAGNPAAVVILPEWLPDATLAAIAAENNLSETAFVLPAERPVALRWFTPTIEIDLCGHATLAAAYVLFRHYDVSAETLQFATRSGVLSVTRAAGRLRLDFPARPGRPVTVGGALTVALGAAPTAAFLARDLMLVFESEEEVRDLRPDFRRLAQLSGECHPGMYIVTAPGREVDFVSRFFAPGAGIDEDPVTGSAHCTLIPYWGERLQKRDLRARQLSARGGELWCELRGDRVGIAGEATEYLRGEIEVPD